MSTQRRSNSPRMRSNPSQYSPADLWAFPTVVWRIAVQGGLAPRWRWSWVHAPCPQIVCTSASGEVRSNWRLWEKWPWMGSTTAWTRAWMGGVWEKAAWTRPWKRHSVGVWEKAGNNPSPIPKRSRGCDRWHDNPGVDLNGNARAKSRPASHGKGVGQHIMWRVLRGPRFSEFFGIQVGRARCSYCVTLQHAMGGEAPGGSAAPASRGACSVS